MCLRMLIRSPFMFVGGIIMAIALNKGMSLSENDIVLLKGSHGIHLIGIVDYLMR